MASIPINNTRSNQAANYLNQNQPNNSSSPEEGILRRTLSFENSAYADIANNNNEYGGHIAGEDEKITLDELLILDADEDGALSYRKIDAQNSEPDNAQNSETGTNGNLRAGSGIQNSINALEKINQSEYIKVGGKKEKAPVDNKLDFALEFDENTLKAHVKQDEQSLLILRNFYQNSSTGGGVITFAMNEFGQRIAGNDLKISQEELDALDANKDGTLTQAEISKVSGEMGTDISRSIDYIEQHSQDVRDGQLKKDILFFDENQIKDVNSQAPPSVILNSFYKENGTEDRTMGDGNTRSLTKYTMTAFGKEIAGADGKITAEDLNALDTNSDGHLSTEEVQTRAAEFRQKYENYNPEIDIAGTVNSLEQKAMNKPVDGQLDWTMNISMDDYQNILDNEHDQRMLLNAFYKDPVANEGYVNLSLNELGERIAGEDHNISKEELSSLDANKDGKITREEIQKKTDKLKTVLTETIHQMEEYASSEDGGSDYLLDNSFSFSLENLEKIKENGQADLILNAFYTEAGDPREVTMGDGHKEKFQYFRLNDYGKELAGEDGKLSVDELGTVDTNNDGMIVAEEVGRFLEMRKVLNLFNKLEMDGTERGNIAPGKIELSVDTLNKIQGEEELQQVNMLLDHLYHKTKTIKKTTFHSTASQLEHFFTGGDSLAKKEVVGYEYSLNDFGRSIAGDDKKITIDDLLSLDVNKDGTLSEEEIINGHNDFNARNK